MSGAPTSEYSEYRLPMKPPRAGSAWLPCLPVWASTRTPPEASAQGPACNQPRAALRTACRRTYRTAPRCGVCLFVGLSVCSLVVLPAILLARLCVCFDARVFGHSSVWLIVSLFDCFFVTLFARLFVCLSVGLLVRLLARLLASFVPQSSPDPRGAGHHHPHCVVLRPAVLHPRLRVRLVPRLAPVPHLRALPLARAPAGARFPLALPRRVAVQLDMSQRGMDCTALSVVRR